ncbi:MAG: helix-turn-helix domain-containing protein [Amnibacterium sp.]
MADRDLTGDAGALRALAHPLRLSLLELLGREGPLTATEAAERLGELPGTMSWHLNTLAKHGFVAEEASVGRRRPWRLVGTGNRWDDEAADPASDALTGIVAERAIARLRQWLATRGEADPAWRRAAPFLTWSLWVTPDELERLGEQLMAVLEPLGDRLTDPSARPAGAAPVDGLISIHPAPALGSDR